MDRELGIFVLVKRGNRTVKMMERVGEWPKGRY